MRIADLRANLSLAEVRREVRRHPGTWWGFDFPFGLPKPMLRAAGYRGRSFAEVLGFLSRCASAERFRRSAPALSARAVLGRREIRRRTDREEATPFCVNNLRLYRQTFHGILGLLAPLRAGGGVAVLPWDLPHPGEIVVLEACPASLLGRLGLRLPYKGRGHERRAARARILAEVSRREGLRVSRAQRRTILGDPSGDRLDALLCALIARSAARLRARRLRALRADYGDCEGLVFAG